MSLIIALLGLVAVPLLALGTTRQATDLFTPPLDATRCRRLRGTGWSFLLAGFLAVLFSGDVARTLVGWIGQLGLDALVTALACTLVRTRRASGS
ncbi:DUF3325 family protein [Gluconacetobacter tumulisoli]|uniref:DUF3325 family protein n=1 Tax=Gluconacetobacter tumulisoli TaxID=1286189 RepID=A0A7W4PLN2_9PROT|nr:DUF3325 family protein [Gluconacetobacter tumulisoli]MBB2202315.1 DUF3325 family protein [Gluconacetobacter tumulisoli]